MIRRVLVLFLLGLALGAAIIVTYWVMEALLSNYSDYERGMWEGAAVVMTMNGGFAVVNGVLKRAEAKTKKRRSV